MIIYKITNKINGKIYIGLTIRKSALCRFHKHVSEAKCTNENRYFLNAIRKHGKDNFILEEIDKANNIEELKEKEKFYISLYNATDRSIGYNRSLGGDGTPGVKKSEETREKMRQKALGRKWSDETRKKILETRKNANIDYSKAKENCRLHNLKTSKKVFKYDLNNNLIKEYNSISETIKDSNISRRTFDRYRKNKSKSLKGFIFKIAD